jgi:hypothetical protein
MDASGRLAPSIDAIARSRCHAGRQHHSRPHRKTHRPARTPAWLVRRRSSAPHKQRPPEAERPYKATPRFGRASRLGEFTTNSTSVSQACHSPKTYDFRTVEPGALNGRPTEWGGSENVGERTMSDEFHILDAREKAALEAALKRCRVVAGQIESILRNESGTSLTRFRWQTFTRPLSALPMSSDRKGDSRLTTHLLPR